MNLKEEQHGLSQTAYFPLKNDMMEQEMMDRMKNSKNILNLPKMNLHKQTRQGVGNIIKIL